MNNKLPVNVKGHVLIQDDLGNVLVDKENAVHPQNMARIIARALSNEHNFRIHRIAFGNGGTQTNAAFTTTFKTPNDGQTPDVNTWDSTLYNETYSEIIDEGESDVLLNSLFGTGPGSSPASDPPPTGAHTSGGLGVVSNELGLTSQVVIKCVLNENEPSGQFLNDSFSPSQFTESSFVFDEIGLFTTGAPPVPTAGYQNVYVGNKTVDDDTGLAFNTTYNFQIKVDSDVSFTTISFTTGASGSGPLGQITYGDLVNLISSSSSFLALSNTATVSATDNVSNIQTYGFLKFTSNSTGSGSKITLNNGAVSDLFSNLNVAGGAVLQTPVNGLAAGVQNDPDNPENERERLLTHIIFAPVLKSSNRKISISYTLTISVARTVEV